MITSPGWAEGATLRVNGKKSVPVAAGRFAVVKATWKSGDQTHNGLPDLQIEAYVRFDVVGFRGITTRCELDGESWQVVGEEKPGD